VTLAWRQTWSRLIQMSWEELHTRVGQAVSKRVDVALFRTGLQPGRNGVGHQSPPSGKFFFLTDDLPGITSVLQKHLRPEMESILREADEICRHRFRLLGYADLEYGAEIDWHLDAVHGKRSPLKPWFKIDFIDFAEVGDHKVTWELNRHQHLVTLAKAWRLSQQEKYATELKQQWYSWQRANPYPIGINWGSSLEVAFRSISWLWVRHLLADCPAFTAEFEADLLHGLALTGRHIERYLSTYFSPNTHLLGEAVALFFIGTLCPQFPSAERWRNEGWRIVLEEADRQVRPDGVYFEQSLYYHVYALDFLLHARILAVRNQREIPPSFDATLGRMLDVLKAVSQTGPPLSFGDDDGGRVFSPRRDRPEHLRDPLALGAVIFQREDLRAAATLTEEAVWLCGEGAISYLEGQPSVPKPEPKSFAAGGIYVMASSERCAQQMVIDAGPQGTGRSGHGHADALSIRVSLDGQPWLIDPGTFCYISPGNERNLFRGTGAHNTLRVDNLDQAIPAGPFAWNSIPGVRAERWLPGATCALFVGSHTGYLRLPDPVLHRRFIFHLPGNFWLVRDVAEARESHELETSWHFAPHLTVENAKNGFIARNALETQAGECMRLALLPAQPSGWTSEVKTEQVSPAYGSTEPAQVVRCRAKGSGAQQFTVLLAFLGASDEPGEFIELVGKEFSGAGFTAAYRHVDDKKTHYVLFQDSRKRPWSLGRWTSDAEVFYCGVEGHRVTHLVLFGGSFAKLGDEMVVSLHHAVDRFEWIRREEVTQVFSSDTAALQSLSEHLLESCDAVF
jgi:hypothetical protein